MSMANVIKAVRARCATATTKTYAGMRVAGQDLPCIVYDLSLEPTVHMPGTAGTKSHFMVTLNAQCMAATLDDAAGVADDLFDAFDGGPFTHTGCKLTTVAMTFETSAEPAENGEHDAERIIAATITLQAKET
jgi:hypothetical protein